MGNCLVTKLKGTVDNNNLPVLNTFTFEKYIGKGNSQISITPASLIEVVEGNGHLYDDQNNDLGTSTTASWVKLLSADTAKIRVYNKYSAEHLVIENFKGDDLQDDIKYLSPNILQLALLFPAIKDGGEGMHGSIDELPVYANLKKLVIQNGADYQVNIESVPSKFPSLNICNIFINNSMEGDFVEMVKRYVQGGRTTGAITMGDYNYVYVPSRHLKFNGEEFIGDCLGMTLTWSTENGTTTVTLTSTNKDPLTATFTL